MGANSGKTILVVDEDPGQAERLKELIEFMDANEVVAATPANWQQRVDRGALEALFVGPDLSQEALDTMLVALEEFSPDAAVVVVQAKT